MRVSKLTLSALSLTIAVWFAACDNEDVHTTETIRPVRYSAKHPMAISLAFGVLFATAITLFLVPSLYLMLEDWLKFWGLDKAKDPALVEHEPVADAENFVGQAGS